MAKFDADFLKRARPGDYVNPFEGIGEAMGLIQANINALIKGQFTMTLRIGDAFAPSMTPEEVRAGKIVGFGGKEFTISHLAAGLDELIALFKDKKLINKIVKDAYDSKILPVLIRRLPKSLARQGAGEHMRVHGDPEKLAGQNRRERFFIRDADELTDKWKQVYNLLTSPGKIVNTGVVQGFSLDEVLAIKMDSAKSQYTSVFMMAEFGTGRVADPGPRRYQSKDSTPYKISPTLAAFGGDTSWWFSIGKSRAIAKRVLDKFKKVSRGKSKSIKSRLIRETDTSNLFTFAMGAPGKRSIKPRHAIFDARGMVQQLSQAYEQAYKYIAEELDAYVSKKIPSWPKGGVKYDVARFLLPELPKIVR